MVNLWLFLLRLLFTPTLGEFFDSEDDFPANKFHGFIDVFKAQLEGVLGIRFAMSPIYKTPYAVI